MNSADTDSRGWMTTDAECPYIVDRGRSHLGEADQMEVITRSTILLD